MRSILHRATREHMNWAGKASLDWTPKNLAAQDCIVIATHHSAFQLDELAANADLIIDTRNAMNGVKTKPGQVVKA